MLWTNKDRIFEFRKGPVFANVILADEINRTPPKTQAALLESMQEKRVSVGGVIYDLPKPFFVLATQNPIEQEGTYPLPEAQMDRFLMHVLVDYPAPETEREILGLSRKESRNEESESITAITQDTIFKARQQIGQIHMSPAVEEYLVQIVLATRNSESYGGDLLPSHSCGDHHARNLERCKGYRKGQCRIDDISFRSTICCPIPIIRNGS